jgi:hypothetical protein
LLIDHDILAGLQSDRLLQRRARPPRLALHIALTASEGVGGLGDRQILVVAEQHAGPLTRGKSGQRLHDRVAIGD